MIAFSFTSCSVHNFAVPGRMTSFDNFRIAYRPAVVVIAIGLGRKMKDWVGLAPLVGRTSLPQQRQTLRRRAAVTELAFVML